MIVFRLCHGKHKADISGKGAEIAGGRWNSKGKRILYTSESRALCTAEVAVHMPLGITPQNYYLQSIEIPRCKVIEIDAQKLSDDWKNFPHEVSTKSVGDDFIDENKYLVLKVPSAVVQDEYNYLINPYHRLFAKVKIIKIEPYRFDKRLFEKL